MDIVHVGKRKYTCDTCGGSYKCRDTINRHKRLHAKECNFPCNVCDKNFIDKTELKVHMRVHTGERPFSCHLCDRRFRIRVHLSYHLQRHDNVKQTCKVCGKEFINSESLRIHSFRHKGIMPYMCLICDYGSAKRNYFVTHMLHKHGITMTDDELFAMFKANTGRSPRVKLAKELEIMEKNSINLN
ncbi:PREDICTED: oocyte zinc finger protein XlCOF19-like [Rhagoletis zephyria]|uniref:oocyte zinc finger protein XlCOF19-like n=1 Tax=Rhagoletis zephyria TaxID=28612 RepID=UPI0008118631|nr:PREDICTED: oocyte zinc finger protein XlCOF19-like [Rhagoletis zephyria]